MTSRGGTREEGIEFLVLGPLEARIEDEPLPLGGAKQRAVLAVLLLHADESVSVERLIDEVWGDGPPPSAAHTLEAYVSRLRQLLSGRGPVLVRRGAGYVLELRGAGLDSQRFEALVSEADLALDAGDLARAAWLSGEAASLWRGPAVPDVPLASAGRAAAERLEQMRLRAFELRFDAELALGRHEAVADELQPLVGQNPYRERFVGQLMLALYRSGRQAEALEVYEQTRRRLDNDLGLQPSTELRELSGQIVRQEPTLKKPSPAVAPARAVRLPGKRVGRVARLATVAAVLTAATALTAGSAAPQAATAPGSDVGRIALILPRSPEAALDVPRIRVTADAFEKSIESWRLDGEIVVADEVGPSPSDVEATVRQLEDADFGLVVVLGGGATARALAPVVRRMTETRFAFVDTSLAELALEQVGNATGVPFADYQTGQLAGYVSGLVPPLAGRAPTERADVVSIIVSRDAPRVEHTVRAFERGVRRALPGAAVLVEYVEDEHDKTACERLANEQVDAGSDVVYAVAGECSAPALAVAKLRGVWGIRANDDDVADGPHILATTYKRWDQAIEGIVGNYALERLPGGRDEPLTLADNYAVDMLGEGSPEVNAVWSKVVRLCSRLRAQSENAS